MEFLLVLALQDIPFETIAQESLGERSPVGERVIRDVPSWKAFWTLCNGHKIPAPPPPKIDFAAESVLAVVWGTKPSSGFKVEIARIERTADALLVHVKRQTPPRGLGQLAVITVPAVIVRAKLPDLPVKFVDDKP